MADISTYPGLRHLRGAPTVHIRHVDKGKLIHEGTGLSFWFRPRTAVLSEVPVDDRELPMLFHARTHDYQDVTVQLTITYRCTDPETATARIDFSIDPDTGTWRQDPLSQIANTLTESTQQHALKILGTLNLDTAIRTGVERVKQAVTENLTATHIGLEIIDIRVVAIRPDADMEKALQTTVREKVQQEADKATYERRAMAVERERSISENELQNQIELAKREELLVVQRGANALKKAEDHARASRVADEAKADGIRKLAEAEAAGEKARLDAYKEIPQETLYALAAKELAGNLPEIGSLTLTPDLIQPLLQRLAR
ncbi:SPFH domain-containing protein [Lentzea flaviverrucosa]|uniref:SPFH domain / Band 7 family protein n=1 Tax=Lentzea flaviverrucosa TaxID=200379 RepID=A0A1H9U8R6_9PSEU|nr:SPFH domain-containing protein [Lentzea flaviverrucosa]RDI33248.1 SPFH domain/Band 7 family protein [Lentzea flaviverrucosa]SES05729.1 SPFH domain / Band 7 family protein [Lentzea flaviverrucosa]